MTEEVNEEILGKIRKVAGYLKSDNPNEAANAAAKLSALLLKYNLDASQIPGSAKTRDEFINEATDGYKRMEDWRVDLASAVARANLCRIVVSRGYTTVIHWLGRKSNVEVAQYINYTVASDLERQAEIQLRAVQLLFKEHAELVPGLKPIHGKTFKARFYLGAVDEIAKKLRQELNEQKAAAEDMRALIVANDFDLNEYVKTQFPHLSRGKGSMVGEGGAYGLGRSAGQQMSFKTGLGAGGSSSVKRIGNGN